MTKRYTASVVAGAVAMASGAYAVGTQVGGGTADAAAGSATAANAATPYGGRGTRGTAFRDQLLADAAQRLGVTQARLETALRELRAESTDRSGRRTALAQALADDLNLPLARVQTALAGLKDDRREAFADALAQELRVDAAKVRAAFADLRDDGVRGRGRGARGANLTPLAEAIGVSTSRLRAALREVRPERRADRDTTTLAQRLATALGGVERSRVEASLEDYEEGHEARHEAQRDALAAALAGKLGITSAKVEAVIDDLGGRFGGFGGGRHR